MQERTVEQLFNVSVALYQDSREFVIGNAQLPLEDLNDLVKDYDAKTGGYIVKEEKAVLELSTEQFSELKREYEKEVELKDVLQSETDQSTDDITYNIDTADVGGWKDIHLIRFAHLLKRDAKDL